MEYLIAFYLIGVVVTFLLLTISTLYRGKIPDFSMIGTAFMIVFTSVVWFIFVGYVCYIKHEAKKNKSTWF